MATTIATITGNGTSSPWATGAITHIYFTGVFDGARCVVEISPDGLKWAPAAAGYSQTREGDENWRRFRPVAQPMVVDEPIAVSIDGHTDMQVRITTIDAGPATQIVVTSVP